MWKLTKIKNPWDNGYGYIRFWYLKHKDKVGVIILSHGSQGDREYQPAVFSKEKSFATMFAYEPLWEGNPEMEYNTKLEHIKKLVEKRLV